MRHLGILSAVTAVVALGGCTGSGDTPEPTGTPPAASTEPGPTGTDDATAVQVDCEAVDLARQQLTDATNAELDRLEIARSDPRAFSVQVLVTSQEAAEYWTALRDAVDPAETELRAAADAVVDYWEPLDADLEAIEIPDADEATLAAATDAYLEVSSQHPDEDVVPAQERLTAGIDAACGAATAP